MKFSYSAVWNETVRLIRAHASILIALAGVFIFLPALLMGYFLPRPEAKEQSELWQLWGEYFSASSHWLLLQIVVSMIGTIAMTFVVLSARTSVGEALQVGLRRFIIYFAAWLIIVLLALVSLAPLFLLIRGGAFGYGQALGGLSLLFIFVYALLFVALAVRLICMGPVTAMERVGPIGIIQRSWQLTQGNFWAVLGLVILVAIPGAIIAMVINLIFGLIFVALASDRIVALLTLIVESATGAALSAVMVVLYAAIYRALTSRKAEAEVLA